MIDKSLEMLRVHIAPVGFEVDRIVLPASNMRADRVWLIIHSDSIDDAGQPFSKLISERLEKDQIEFKMEYADRTDLFDTLRVLRRIILKEKNNAILVNVSVGSKIQAIASMMACMIFKDEVDILPYYAVPEKYVNIPREQETAGLKKVLKLPEYKIETPPNHLIHCLKIIHERSDNRIANKDLRDQALARDLIHVERDKNYDQSAYMALKTNLIEPLLKWKFVRVEKIGRRHDLVLTEDGLNALKFLHPV
jgi:Domain of unknown function (DUF6293)/DUF6293 C-terminal winged helix domain